MTLNPSAKVLALLLALFLSSTAPAAHAHDHRHGQMGNETGPHDGHEVIAEVDDHDCADHHESNVIELSPEAMKLAGIQLSRVESGHITREIDLPGEVGFNEDMLLRVRPRFAGIAREARYRVGDYVNAGDVVAVIESNESLTPYRIETAISGWIIERHIAPGEFITEQHTIYVIADLSTVWVNLAVYPRDAGHIAAGRPVTLKAIGYESRAEGVIDYISPVLDAGTRSIAARVILPNPNNAWRPGTFVQAQVRIESGAEHLVVKRNAVQILDDEHVVFIAEGEGRFRSVPVAVGDGDAEYIRIISGLEKGTQYVTGGAFELKAKVVTSSLGDHAGHGH